MIYYPHQGNRKKHKNSYPVFYPVENTLTYKFYSVRQKLLNQSKRQYSNLQAHKKSLSSNKIISCPNFCSHSNKFKKTKKKLKIKAIRTSLIHLSCPYKLKNNQKNSEKNKKIKMRNLTSFMKG